MNLEDFNLLWARYQKLDSDMSHLSFGAALFGRLEAKIELLDEDRHAIGRVLSVLVDSFEDHERRVRLRLSEAAAVVPASATEIASTGNPR